MIKGGWHQTLAKGARPECFRHWRLWAGFGDWEWTKVKDVVFESLFCKIYRACKEWHGWTGNAHFFDRLRFVHWLEQRTIEEGWADGLGPEGKPFWMCVETELQCRDFAMEYPF